MVEHSHQEQLFETDDPTLIDPEMPGRIAEATLRHSTPDEPDSTDRWLKDRGDTSRDYYLAKDPSKTPVAPEGSHFSHRGGRAFPEGRRDGEEKVNQADASQIEPSDGPNRRAMSKIVEYGIDKDKRDKDAGEDPVVVAALRRKIMDKKFAAVKQRFPHLGE